MQLNHKKSSREARRKLAARIVAGLLAFLMLAGTAYYMIYMIAISAAEPLQNPKEDLNIRIGLMYGDGVTVGFETETPAGYTVGVQPLMDDIFEFFPFWSIPDTKISVTADANLTKKNSTYSITSGTKNAVVGGYHIEFITDYGLMDIAQAQILMTNLDAVLASVGLYSFPAYINGVIRIRVGSYVSRAQAESQYPFVAGVLSYFNSTIVEPSATAVSVLNPATDRIIFEYDSSEGTSLGLSAVDVNGEDCYIKTPAKNVYDGVFAYTRYREEGVDGVAVTNVLTLDEYVEGVVPYEVSNEWPLEALKAFAIATRSYAASTLDRHEKSYQFDLCNGTHCQVYKGAGRVNDNVINAALSTHGLIITYNGDIAKTFYSSSCGGVTVSINDVWGGASYPYLVAHETPWERYSEHNYGMWTVEISPKDLLKYLKEQKGYSTLRGSVKNIEVLEYAPGSTYVNRLRITDTYGTSIDIDHTDHIRTALSAYVKSANFVVGKGSVDYTVDTVNVVGETIIDARTEKQVRKPLNQSGGTPQSVPQSVVMDNGTISVLTAGSIVDMKFSDAVILTASALEKPQESQMHVCSNTGVYHLTEKTAASQQIIPRVVKEYSLTTETKTAKASSSQNFIFVGKGFGHGAGMSQYGAMDLAELGYDYEHIINAYYTDVDIVYYKNIEELNP